MKFSEVQLPSNKKFGFFFTFLFLVLALYFYTRSYIAVSYIFTGTALIFSLVTIFKANFLLPLNKLWMQFGLLLGMIVSPIVLGLIFFGLFTPIALLMRLIGRDELCLNFVERNSYWIKRNTPIQTESFKDQF